MSSIWEMLETMNFLWYFLIIDLCGLADVPDLYSTSFLALHIVYIQDNSFSCNLCLRILEIQTAFSKKARRRLWSLLTWHCTCQGETTNQTISEQFMYTVESHQVHNLTKHYKLVSENPRFLRCRFCNAIWRNNVAFENFSTVYMDKRTLRSKIWKARTFETSWDFAN